MHSPWLREGEAWERCCLEAKTNKTLQFCRSCSHAALCPAAVCLQGMQSSSCDPVSTWGANQAVVWQEGAVSDVTLTLSVRALASLVYQRWELCVCCLLVKAESSGVYIVHVLLVVTNLMRVFSLIQNILWLWHFMFLPLSKLQNGACKTSSPLGHAVFNPGIPRYVIWWVSWIFSYAEKST